MQGTAIYGLPYGFTVYGGVQASQYYDALALGVGKNIGDPGPFRWMSPTPNQRCRIRIPPAGAPRIRYSKDFATTGTHFSIAGYRYNSKGSTPCRTRWIPIPVMTTGNAGHAPQPRGGDCRPVPGGAFGSLTLSPVKENYWNSRDDLTEPRLQQLWHGISYGLSYGLDKTRVTAG